MAKVTTGGDPTKCPICNRNGTSDHDGIFICLSCEYVWVDGDEEEWLDVPEYASDPDDWRT